MWISCPGCGFASAPKQNRHPRGVAAPRSRLARGNASLAADLYAPGSPVSVGGTGDFYGTLVGKTLTVQGRAGVHYGESVQNHAGAYAHTRLVQ